jgi:cytochrome b subunit of formate dehydrogenase
MEYVGVWMIGTLIILIMTLVELEGYMERLERLERLERMKRSGRVSQKGGFGIVSGLLFIFETILFIYDAITGSVIFLIYGLK